MAAEPLAAGGQGAHEAMVRQLGFYFSEANLRRDAFMQAQLGDDGLQWMEVSLFLNFNRISRLATDAHAVAAALVDLAGTVELSTCRTRVRRLAPVVPASREAMDSRTVYVEQLPSWAEQRSVEEAMARAVGPVSYVALPHFEWPARRPIKGYAFVEFVHEHDAVRAPGIAVVMRRPAAAAGAPAADGASAPEAEAAAAVLPPPPERALRVMLKRDWLALRDDYAKRVSAQLSWVGAQRERAADAAQRQQQLRAGADGGAGANCAAAAAHTPLSAVELAQAKGSLLRIAQVPREASRDALMQAIQLACAPSEGRRALGSAEAAEAGAADTGAAAQPSAAHEDTAPATMAYLDFPKGGEQGVAYARFLKVADARACAERLRGTHVFIDGPAAADGAAAADGGLEVELLAVDGCVDYWHKVNLERAQRWLKLQRKRALDAPGAAAADAARGRGSGGVAARGAGARGCGAGARGRGTADATSGRSGGRGVARGGGSARVTHAERTDSARPATATIAPPSGREPLGDRELPRAPKRGPFISDETASKHMRFDDEQ